MSGDRSDLIKRFRERVRCMREQGLKCDEECAVLDALDERLSNHLIDAIRAEAAREITETENP